MTNDHAFDAAPSNAQLQERRADSAVNVRPLITDTNPRVLVIDVGGEIAAALAKGIRAAFDGRRFMVDRDAASMGDAAAHVLRRILPDEALQQLRCFRREGRQILHFTNPDYFNVGLPPTPVRGFGDDPRVQIYDGLLLGMFSLIGYTPIAFEFENFGRLFRNVVPNPDSKGQKSSHGFDEPLGWHIDNPCGTFEGGHTPWMSYAPIPRVLGFVCLRNQDVNGQPVSTDVLLLDAVCEHLDRNAFLHLQRPEYQVNPPASNNCEPLRGVPLIECVDGQYCFRFNADSSQVFGLTKQAESALEELNRTIAAADAGSLQFPLSPGSLLVFDNYKVAHRRRCFDPGTNSERARWLRRCYGLGLTCSGRHVDRASWPYLLN